MITDKELKQKLNEIHEKYKDTDKLKQAIAEAFTFGTKYREQQIKEGIGIVFESLHMKMNSDD